MNLFVGPVVNAAYAIGNQVKSSVNLFGSNFYVAVRPVMMKEYASGNIGYVKKLFFTSSETLFLLLFIIIVPISLLFIICLCFRNAYLIICNSLLDMSIAKYFLKENGLPNRYCWLIFIIAVSDK